MRGPSPAPLVRARGRAPRILGLGVLWFGCSEEGADRDAPAAIAPCTHVVSLESFTVIRDALEDPWDHRPAAPKCLDWAVHVEPIGEEAALSTATGPCPYMTATAPTLVAIPSGTELELRWFHFALTATATAEAHAAARVAGHPVLDATIPIPSESGMVQTRWVAPEELPAGAAVHLHLHNHGDNSWAFLGLRTPCE